ncbi:MAG: vitamin B12 dependent-methionine synthase activation domain-containing protein [Rikenellaceae bacterium]
MLVDIAELTLSRREIYRAMGYGSTTPEQDICALVETLLEEVMTIAHPSLHYSIAKCQLSGTTLITGGESFDVGETIAKLLNGSNSAALFVATAGIEVQRWLDRITNSGDTLNMFIADAIGSTLVESVGDLMERKIEAEIGSLLHTNRFSPGYCGWQIEQQQRLFAAMADGVCGVELNANSLMYPIKSISGVIGIGESVVRKKYGCSICSRADCYMRKKH